MILLSFFVGLALGGEKAPDPKAGGPGSRPVALLVISAHWNYGGNVLIDKQYEQELTEAGYRVVAVPFSDLLSPEYLKQFGVILLTRLPFAGKEYSVEGGILMAHLKKNLAMIDDYVAAGGALVFLPFISNRGEGYVETYNDFLEKYGVRYIAQQLRHDAFMKGTFAEGEIHARHAIAKGLKKILYPANVLRWDHAYSTTPFLANPEWTIIATGRPGSGTHQAISNKEVGKRLTDNKNIFAIRPYKKGYVAVSAIHSYYTLSHPYYTQRALGEMAIGVIKGSVLHGEKDGRKSDFGELLDRTYRFLAANSAKHGIGTGMTELPPQPEKPPFKTVIDWHTQEPPPTWQHRVFPDHANRVYDERPDPLVQGELQYFKALIGPRTILSSGKGTVKAWREAAIRAGYSVIFFCETFEDTDKETWDYFVQNCKDNSDEKLICMPGMEIEGFQGGQYLILGTPRYPDPTWLTDDGKKLKATRMLSLGWHGHVASIHRPGSTPLSPKMYKMYQGITVYTYDGQGTLIDDGLHAYQWAVRSDSVPIPIVAHELTHPDQVQKASASGFQQVLPAPELKEAVKYFRNGVPHFFDNPVRYFISQGPILDGWSIFNKDIGKAEWNRDHYRIGIGVKSENPIAEVTLYDGFEVARRWFPNKKEFRTRVDGMHDAQHEYILMARDAAGRRVLSPGIRTVTRNWRLRCADRQNWIGPAMFIYTGCNFHHPPAYSISFRNAWEGVRFPRGRSVLGGNPCPIFDFPFFSNHVQISDVDLTAKYVSARWKNVQFDAKSTHAVRATDLVDGHIRTVYFTPLKRGNFAVVLVQVDIKLKRDVEPTIRGPIYPTLARSKVKNKRFILPGKEPMDVPKRAVDLPVGSYAAGYIPLTKGLRLHERTIGFPAPPADTLTLYEGTAWHAEYLVLKRSRFHWKDTASGWNTDPVAEQALSEMGFRGETPYAFTLTQGKLDRLAYIADFTAEDGGVAGSCRNAKDEALLFFVPLRIRGLNPRCATAVWRSDSQRLDYFDCFQDIGYVTFNADKTVDFYAGNVASCDPALFVSVVIWNEEEAWFRVNNPTKRDIVTEFTTVSAIQGFKPVKKTITVKAGTSLDIKE